MSHVQPIRPAATVMLVREADAGIRESFEEAGLLLAYDGEGTLLRYDTRDVERRFDGYRVPLQSGRVSLHEILRRENLRLAVDRIHCFPVFRPREPARDVPAANVPLEN